jgi:hypothetical protein
MVDISNEPNSLTLVIVQGSTLSFGVVITDAATDFTGATARAKVMVSFASRTNLQTLTVTVNSAVNGSMDLTVSLTAAETALLSNTTAGERRQPIGVWDLEVVLASGAVTRMAQGAAQLSREATIA